MSKKEELQEKVINSLIQYREDLQEALLVADSNSTNYISHRADLQMEVSNTDGRIDLLLVQMPEPVSMDVSSTHKDPYEPALVELDNTKKRSKRDKAV